MVLKEVEKLLDELEKAELEAPNGGATPQTYTQLLAVYLYQNDICNAKYLWKRIPANVKANSNELQQVWLVGQRMWQRDWPAVHAALSTEWSEDINSIMNALKENVRERAVILISEAYSSLTLITLASMTGLSAPEAQTLATEREWKIEGDMVQPKRIDKDYHLGQNSLTEDQLHKLTQFVSFLEN
ncbi:COP9 signalosome complex subunit 8 [Neodiprion virginianus]|uniref:COP9 signalosome complex subunit 8 n=1 Tax=Neodiprion lecontei TaxID=441921 RepID=A0A6J0BAL0_NEOLC|nr:COP9 signalosome complex subunit 8 [Neodiprion lecontei]XP_046425991.1 COP9 signalosome complex subunit 8 [Neodiprion fabricii]XP_046619704.1 COP9 signalosome complex subunit 8 [Neodiprion virginianus]